MMLTTAQKVRAFAIAIGLALAAAPALAQTYPGSPVHLIVAYSAGGTGDVVARIVAPKLSIALGQSVIVENRAGASGAIGAHSVATASPDGLTLLIGQTAEVAINQHWLKGLSYDPDKNLRRSPCWRSCHWRSPFRPRRRIPPWLNSWRLCAPRS